MWRIASCCSVSPNPKVSTNQEKARLLLAHLSHPTLKLKLPEGDLEINAEEALARMAKGDYQFGFRSERVRFMRPVERVAVIGAFQECWRTTKAAVLEPGLDWGRTA